jgi:DNA polymerase-3 subunit gamma/tau
VHGAFVSAHRIERGVDPELTTDLAASSTAPHLALYRRWRAQTFSRIVGQEAVVTTLRNAVRTGQVAHALLFVGPRGTGKTSMARIVAKALNCPNLQDGDPCDTCPSCVAIRDGRTLDVVELDAATNNKVDQIRELVERTWTAPSGLRRKVFIIDEVQRIDQGWDVLLKTLEEPPDHVVFIFCTTDPTKIRPAVLSRVQRYEFRRLTVAQIEGKLTTILAADGRQAESAAVDLVARQAAGGMRDAESMLDQLLASSGERLTVGAVRELLGLVDGEVIDAFVDALVRGDPLAGISLLDEVESSGRDLGALLDQVVVALRTALSGALAGTVEARPDRTIAGLTGAARRIAGIDPSRQGAGGLRFQLELALLAPAPARPAEPVAERAFVPVPAPKTASAPSYSPEPEPASEPSVTEPSIHDPLPDGPPQAAAGEKTTRRSAPRAEPTPSTSAPPPVSVPAAAVSADAVLDQAAPDQAASDQAAPPAAKPPAEEPVGATSAVTPPAVAPTERRAVGPGPEVDVAASTASPGEAVDGLRALDLIWPAVVAELSKSPPIKPLIEVCRPIDIQGDVVTLGFPEGKAFLKDVAERRRPTLEVGISRALGRAVSVRLVATNLDILPPPVDEEAERLLAAARRIFADDLVDAGEIG